MSVKYLNAGNDHMIIPEVYKCLPRTQILSSHARTARATFQFKRFSIARNIKRFFQLMKA